MKKKNVVLQDLLKKCDKNAAMPEAIVYWDKVKLIGKEIESDLTLQDHEEMKGMYK